jgi:hypothetical protein
MKNEEQQIFEQKPHPPVDSDGISEWVYIQLSNGVVVEARYIDPEIYDSRWIAFDPLIDQTGWQLKSSYTDKWSKRTKPEKREYEPVAESRETVKIIGWYYPKK